MSKPKFGKLGTFSEGKVSPSDEGDLMLGVAADPAHGIVRIDFGTPVAWLGLPAEHAREFAALILKAADKVSEKPQ